MEIKKEIKRRKSVHTFEWTDETVAEFLDYFLSEFSFRQKVIRIFSNNEFEYIDVVKEEIEKFKNSERNKDIVWIKENKELFSIAGIERAAGLPETSLLQALNGGQKFPKKWEAKLNQFVKKIKSK